MRGLIGRYINEVLRPSYNIPVGGEQEEAAFMSYYCAKTAGKHTRYSHS